MLRRGSLGARLELSYMYVIIYLFQHVLEGVCLSVFGPACNSTMERMTGEITLLTPSDCVSPSFTLHCMYCPQAPDYGNVRYRWVVSSLQLGPGTVLQLTCAPLQVWSDLPCRHHSRS